MYNDFPQNQCVKAKRKIVLRFIVVPTLVLQGGQDKNIFFVSLSFAFTF